MKTIDFKYELPKDLIAKYLILDRSNCRLLLLNSKSRVIQYRFFDIIEEIMSGDLIIFDDTKVIPARLYEYTDTSKRIEVLIERILNDCEALVHIRSSELVKFGHAFNIKGTLEYISVCYKHM